jgi:hypothetical protein
MSQPGRISASQRRSPAAVTARSLASLIDAGYGDGADELPTNIPELPAI